MREICQNDLPIAPWSDAKTRRLPGLHPVEAGDWLRVDDAYAAQMAYRTKLMAKQRNDVYRMSEMASTAAAELLELVLAELRHLDGFKIGENAVCCPDGRNVVIDRNEPLITCGHLVQEDLNIMQPVGTQHVLTGSILCFPASWSLDEKFLGDLTSIHGNVPEYDANIAKRVQRVFDGIQVGRPMWRANYLTYTNPDLFQPRREGSRRFVDLAAPKWMRVERQCLVKMPNTGAVIFSIHSYVVPFDRLKPSDVLALP